eukprot:1160971-Pelagomonas_calceolata.AAC.13
MRAAKASLSSHRAWGQSSSACVMTEVLFEANLKVLPNPLAVPVRGTQRNTRMQDHIILGAILWRFQCEAPSATRARPHHSGGSTAVMCLAKRVLTLVQAKPIYSSLMVPPGTKHLFFTVCWVWRQLSACSSDDPTQQPPPGVHHAGALHNVAWFPMPGGHENRKKIDFDAWRACLKKCLAEWETVIDSKCLVVVPGGDRKNNISCALLGIKVEWSCLMETEIEWSCLMETVRTTSAVLCLDLKFSFAIKDCEALSNGLTAILHPCISPRHT